MGFSTSVVVVIFSAAMMYMATLFYPTADMSYHQVEGANKDSNKLWKEKLNTKIVITSWTGNIITVHNNGSVTLNSSQINVILDGEIKSISSYTVSSQGVWPPMTSIDIDIQAESGRVKIITANGAADYSVK